jgi:hypothetical protein
MLGFSNHANAEVSGGIVAQEESIQFILFWSRIDFPPYILLNLRTCAAERCFACTVVLIDLYFLD